MIIDKNNYEEYIVSSLEGMLNANEQSTLDAFLNEHPKLKREFDVYRRTFLVPDVTITYPDKYLLLKPEPQRKAAALYRNRSVKINMLNYEEFVIRSFEGLLSTEEQASLDTFLHNHPELKIEADAYKMAFLVPDKTVTYPDKALLFKPEPAEHKLIPFYRRYSVILSMAATILLLLVFRVFLYDNMFSAKPGGVSVAQSQSGEQTDMPTFAAASPGRRVDDYFIPSTGNPQINNAVHSTSNTDSNQSPAIQTAPFLNNMPSLSVNHLNYNQQKQNIRLTTLQGNSSQRAIAEAQRLIAQRNQSTLISNAALIGKTLWHLSGRQLPGENNNSTTQTNSQQFHVVTVSYDSKDFSFVKIIH